MKRTRPGATTGIAPGDLRLALRVEFHGGARLGHGKVRLLERIDALGSISAAARELGMSFRRAWTLLATLDDVFAGPLVDAEAGGTAGGGARLTPTGRRVVAAYRAIEAAALTGTDAAQTELRGLLRG